MNRTSRGLELDSTRLTPRPVKLTLLANGGGRIYLPPNVVDALRSMAGAEEDEDIFLNIFREIVTTSNPSPRIVEKRLVLKPLEVEREGDER